MTPRSARDCTISAVSAPSRAAAAAASQPACPPPMTMTSKAFMSPDDALRSKCGTGRSAPVGRLRRPPSPRGEGMRSRRLCMNWKALIPASGLVVSRETYSFADAKTRENQVEQLLDIDRAGYPFERAGGEAQVFGDELGRLSLLQRRPQPGAGRLQFRPLPGMGDQRRAAVAERTIPRAGRSRRKAPRPRNPRGPRAAARPASARRRRPWSRRAGPRPRPPRNPEPVPRLLPTARGSDRPPRPGPGRGRRQSARRRSRSRAAPPYRPA